MKTILGIYDAPPLHWVGDGFPVRSLFSYRNHGKVLSPFLLLDYAGPTDLAPAERPRGVGQHPHRGFETVTIVYHGEVAHRDSTGKGGVIGPGDVQWMTLVVSGNHAHNTCFLREHNHWNVCFEERLVVRYSHFVLGRQIDPELHHLQPATRMCK